MGRPKPICGNPLWRDWIKEWCDEEQARGSKIYFTYKKALNSLNACHQEFTHPSETKQLHGIGDSIAGRLEKKLKKYCEENGLPMPQRNKGKRRTYMSEITDDLTNSQPKRQKPRTYIPKYRTGGYAILLALLEHRECNNHVNVSKDQIIRLAEDHCDASFDMAEATNKTYTAWASMKTLMDKGYVWKHGSPPTFALTDTGYEIALKLKMTAENSGGSATGSLSQNNRPRQQQRHRDDSSDMEEEVDLSLYVTNPEEYRSSNIASSSNNNNSLQQSSSPRNTNYFNQQNIWNDHENSDGEEEVDLSLYVMEPDKYRSSTNSNNNTNNPSQQQQRRLTAAAAAEARRDSNSQNFQNLWNQSYNNSINTSSQEQSSAIEKQQSITNRSFQNSWNQGYNNNNSSQQRGSESSSRGVTDNINFRNVWNLGYHDDRTSDMGGEEEEVDLSLYVTDPEKYRAATNTTTNNNNNNNTSSSQRQQRQQQRLSSEALTSLQSTSLINRQNKRKKVYRDDNDEDPVDLNMYVTDPAKSQTEIASFSQPRQRDTSTQISLVDDDETESYGPSNVMDNEIFSRYQPPPLDQETTSLHLSSYQPIDFDDDNDVIALDSPTLQAVPPSPLPTSLSQPFLSSLPDPDEISIPDSEFGSQNLNSFQYTYLDNSNKPVRHISQAAVDIQGIHEIGEGGKLWYKIQYSSGQYAHPRTDKLRNVELGNDNTYTGYIAEDDCEIICPGLPEASLLPLNHEGEDNFWPETIAATPNVVCDTRSSSPSFIDSQSAPDSQLSVPPSASQMDAFIEYLPDSYEITLIVDTREIKLRTNRDYFVEQLTARGIRVIKRALELGDMLWVAQKKGSKSSRDELFLDYVVERKRMDDLASSIKDGRFDEQKYRLRHSGAKKVFYIIEEYNKEEVMMNGAQMIQTAMSSTQVVDGFFLKRTATINDTIDYLVTLTKMIQQTYHNVTLYRIPDHLISRTDYLEKKKRYGKNHLITYSIYSGLNSKSDTLTLKDLYLRMLMAIRGVSAEKASSLMTIYPTPSQLLQAYKFKSEEEAKGLAKKMTKDSIGRRRWGQSLSEKLWEVWGKSQ
ncbi:hypothetical protein INT45_008056 [Circinella minor]|uniref:Crossover junction endonuclease MUS81 n=1 Tax=Circinella minor TaxID=1195481 RepID=A0A8H7VRZ2_9FUNG|nr:hypothetical protein INT45_008056 [Circinella minor]